MPERAPRSASLADASVEGRAIYYHCPSCGFRNTCMVLPHSPTIAKHVCANENCERTNDVKTRETFESHIGDHVGEGKDRNRIAGKARAWSNDTALSKLRAQSRQRAMMEMREIEKAYGRTEVDSPWGKATLIN